MPGAVEGSGKRIPRSFQFLLAFYIILTGDLPTVVQAFAFGIQDGVEAEFAAAMLSSFALDLLLLAPVFILANHPLGIFHPVLIAVVLWPSLIHMPSVIEELGGWGPVILGQPVDTPYFIGLGYQTPSQVWAGIAKFNVLEVAAICSTYIGFALWRGRNLVRMPSRPLNAFAARAVLLGLIAASTLALAVYLYYRGGLSEHLFDLGRGRFRSLAGSGGIMMITDIAAISVLLWLAIRPSDAKSLLFIGVLAVVVACQFISNGSRGSAMLAIMMAGLVWALRVQRVPWRIALLLVPFIFLSLGVLNVVRTSSWTGLTAAEAISELGAVEAFETAEEEIRLRRSLSAQVPVIERGFAVAGGPLHGESYIAAATAMIPRSIWEDKPRGPGSLYAQLFLGERREGRAIPIGTTAEAYWNFGVPGVVILAALYGLLLRLVYHYFWRRYPNPFAICFYALFVTTFNISTDALVAFEQQFALLLIVYAVVRFFVPAAERRFAPLPGTQPALATAGSPGAAGR